MMRSAPGSAPSRGLFFSRRVTFPPLIEDGRLNGRHRRAGHDKKAGPPGHHELGGIRLDAAGTENEPFGLLQDDRVHSP
jgi:hypothetical protein